LLLASGGLCKGFITCLKKTKIDELGGPLKGVNRKEIEKFFKDALESRPSETSEEPLLPIFSTERTSMVWCDPEAWETIRSAIPDKDQKRTKEDFDWFNKEFQDPQSIYYGWLTPTPGKSPICQTPIEGRTNQDAISLVSRTLARKGYLSKEVLAEIERRLNAKYG
jgi:hypothetical protein